MERETTGSLDPWKRRQRWLCSGPTTRTNLWFLDTLLCVDTGVIDGAINGGREGEGGNKETQ